MNRRKLHRTRLALTSYVRMGDSSFATGLKGYTENISRGGALLRVKRASDHARIPRAHELVEVLFELPCEADDSLSRCIHGYATVAWTMQSGSDEHLIGVRIERMRFEDLPPGLKKLRKFPAPPVTGEAR